MKYDEPAQITIPFGMKKVIGEQAERKGMDVKTYLMDVCTIEQYTEEEIKNFIDVHNARHNARERKPYLTRKNFCKYINIYHKGLTKERRKRLERTLRLDIICQHLKTIGAIAGILLLLVFVGFLLWAAVKI